MLRGVKLLLKSAAHLKHEYTMVTLNMASVAPQQTPQGILSLLAGVLVFIELGQSTRIFR